MRHNANLARSRLGKFGALLVEQQWEKSKEFRETHVNKESYESITKPEVVARESQN